MIQNGTLKEALPLSEVILSEIELSQAPLTSIALKASRLARLVGNFDQQQIMMYEASGYPKTPKGISSSVWQLAVLAGRTYKQIINSEEKEYCKVDSLEQIELEMVTAKENILAAADVSTSISSANPSQYISSPVGNRKERIALREVVSDRSKWLAARRAYIHSYVSSVYFELKFSSIPSDIFERTRSKVDKKIGELVPGAIKKFSAVYENLISENDEDWANAVHSCRRILQETADSIYPPRADKLIEVGAKQKTVKLGPDNYINRLIAYVEENSESDRFNEIVGSHMRYLGERLDSIFQAAQKGSHHVISSQDEADRYVIYTYLVIGDILQLKNEVETGAMIDPI